VTENLGPHPWSTRLAFNLFFAAIQAINLIVAYIGHLNRRLAIARQQNQLHLQKKMHQQWIRPQQLVQYDSLTQLYSRGYFYECVERLFAKMQRERTTLGIVLLDLDWFKQINDTYGHAGGDRVLETVGSCLMAQLEPQAIAGRLGGEEFAVVQRADTLEAAIAIAERLRQAIAVLHFDGLLSGLRLTASFGVTLTTASDRNLDRAIARADAALYAAKEQGRNCTVTS